MSSVRAGALQAQLKTAVGLEPKHDLREKSTLKKLLGRQNPAGEIGFVYHYKHWKSLFRNWPDVALVGLGIKGSAVLETRDKGVKFFVGSRDQLSGTAGIADETFGQKQYRYLMDNRKGMSVVLDIGAYIGDSALWFATFSGIRKVYAYEAHPYAYGMAKTNIELNGVNGKIELHNMAVGNEGLIRLNDGKSSPSDRLQASADGKLVRIVTLDSILAGISSNRIILKLDCEGSEFEILRKGMDLSKVYLAQLEFHNAVPGKHAEIVGALENSGFNVDVEHRTDTVTGYRDFGFIYAKRE